MSYGTHGTCLYLEISKFYTYSKSWQISFTCRWKTTKWMINDRLAWFIAFNIRILMMMFVKQAHTVSNLAKYDALPFYSMDKVNKSKFFIKPYFLLLDIPAIFWWHFTFHHMICRLISLDVKCICIWRQVMWSRRRNTKCNTLVDGMDIIIKIVHSTVFVNSN